MKRLLIVFTLFAFVATVLPRASDASPTKPNFSYNLKMEIPSSKILPAAIEVAIPELPMVAVSDAILLRVSSRTAVKEQARPEPLMRRQNFDRRYGMNLLKKVVDPVPRE
jgi:hypothetical protein